MIHKKFTFIVAAAVLATLGYTGSAFAGGKTVWTSSDNPCNKLQITGAVRFRYEQTNDDRRGNGSTTDDNEERERVRVRFGFKYNTGGPVSAGARISSGGGRSTGGSTLQSPHQTLGTVNGGGDIEFDKAYIAYAKSGGIVIAGKHPLAFWHHTEVWWDTDINPEGIEAAWSGKMGGGKIGVAAGHFVVNENRWNTDGDDTVTGYELTYATKTGGGIGVKLGYSTLQFNEAKAGNLSDSGSNYNKIALQLKKGPFKAGIDYLSSGVSDEDIEHDGSAAGAAEGGDTKGYAAYVRYKVNKMIGLRFYIYDIGHGAVPVMGTVSQDDFPYSSNFTGTRFQIDIKPTKGLKVDIRLYNQSIKNNQLTGAGGSGTNAMRAPSAGADHSASRLQVNLNVGF